MTDEKWIDTHSVDCVLCGGLADERRTVETWQNELWMAGAWQAPKRYVAIERIIDELGNGEMHPECFDAFVESNGIVSEFRENREKRDHR